MAQVRTRDLPAGFTPANLAALPEATREEILTALPADSASRVRSALAETVSATAEGPRETPSAGDNALTSAPKSRSWRVHGVHLPALPPRSTRKEPPAAEGWGVAALAIVRRHPWATVAAGAVLFVAVLLIGYHSATTSVAPSPYTVRDVRCPVDGQVALAPTAAACKRLQAAAKTVSTLQVPKTLTPTPTKTAAKQSAAPPTTQQPAPKEPTTTTTTTKPSTTTSGTVTFCANPSNGTTTNGPCQQNGLPTGFQRYLCTVENRTDGFCKGV